MFIVLDVTAVAFAPIINMKQTGPWETDWIMIISEKERDLDGFVYFQLCFENIHTRRSRDTV